MSSDIYGLIVDHLLRKTIVTRILSGYLTRRRCIRLDTGPPGLDVIFMYQPCHERVRLFMCTFGTLRP